MLKLTWRLPQSRADLSSSSVRYDTIFDELNAQTKAQVLCTNTLRSSQRHLAVMTLQRCQAKHFSND